MRKAMPINSLTDGDATRVAAALRSLNHTLVAKALPLAVTAELADKLEALVRDLKAVDAGGRERAFGQSEDSESGSGFDYGAGASLAYRPISGNCNALAAPARYFQTLDGMEADVVFGPAFEGPPNLVHGGFVAAYMDEVFGLTIAHCEAVDVPCMTGTLKTIYRLPVPLNTLLTYRARVTGQERRKVFMHCTLTDAAGTVYAEGEAIFLRIDPTVYAQMAQ